MAGFRYNEYKDYDLFGYTPDQLDELQVMADAMGGLINFRRKSEFDAFSTEGEYKKWANTGTQQTFDCTLQGRGIDIFGDDIEDDDTK